MQHKSSYQKPDNTNPAIRNHTTQTQLSESRQTNPAIRKQTTQTQLSETRQHKPSYQRAHNTNPAIRKHTTQTQLSESTQHKPSKRKPYNTNPAIRKHTTQTQLSKTRQHTASSTFSLHVERCTHERCDISPSSLPSRSPAGYVAQSARAFAWPRPSAVSETSSLWRWTDHRSTDPYARSLARWMLPSVSRSSHSTSVSQIYFSK